MAPQPALAENVRWYIYPAAVIVALIATIATVLVCILPGEALGMTSDRYPILSHFLAAGCGTLSGFNGVYFGTLCFPLLKRRFASRLLLFIGLGFYTFTIGFACIQRGEGFPFLPFMMIALGGTIAVVFQLRKKKTDALDSSTGQPSVDM